MRDVRFVTQRHAQAPLECGPDRRAGGPEGRDNGALRRGGAETALRF